MTALPISSSRLRNTVSSVILPCLSLTDGLFEFTDTKCITVLNYIRCHLLQPLYPITKMVRQRPERGVHWEFCEQYDLRRRFEFIQEHAAGEHGPYGLYEIFLSFFPVVDTVRILKSNGIPVPSRDEVIIPPPTARTG